jgi:hypothetical protein
VLTDQEAERVVGATLVSGDGQSLGPVETVYAHAADNRAAWAVVAVEDRRVAVPLDDARMEGADLVVRHPAERVTSAPAVEADELDADAAERLLGHYGIDDAALRDDSGFPTGEGTRQPGGADPRPAGADDAAQGHP